MSCPAELDLALYVDGAQPADGVKLLEAHLVACRECRGRVVHLRDEAALLSDVLLERRREWRTHEPAPAPERELAFGLPAAVAAAMAAFAAVGFLLESRVPGGLDLLNPLRLKGAYEMAFDLIFLLRDRAPGLVELAVSVGTVAGVSAILSFAVSAFYRRAFGPAAALVGTLLLCAPDPAAAVKIALDRDTHVAAGETIEETAVLTGEMISIDGTIEGDLIAAAERINIRGTVDGNVYAFTRDLEISGTVTGSVHSPGERILVSGEVGRSIYSFTERFTLATGGRIGRDVGVGGDACVIDGEVGRDVVFGGEWLEVRGRVARDVQALWAERIALRDGARIAGRLNATMPGGAEVERASDTEVGGGIQVSEDHPVRKRYLDHYLEPGFYLFHLLQLAGAFLFGLVVHRLAPGVLEGSTPSGGGFFRLLGIGFVALVATPVAIVVIGFTVVGIPVAVAGLFAYIVACYTAIVAVGALVGRALLPPRDASTVAFGLSLLAGLAAVFVATHVPFAGPAAFVVVLLFGLGVLSERVRALVSASRSAA